MVALGLMLASASNAGAFIYWSILNENHAQPIGRAHLDGTSPNGSFITGLHFPEQIAVRSGHIYWASWGSQAIGRANINGSGVNPKFVDTAPHHPSGVAVDANHIYWADEDGGGGTAIGRADLNGGGVTPSFITDTNHPYKLAVDAGHIYWTSYSGIGRATLDASVVEPTFIQDIGGDTPGGIAVDAAHIYRTAPYCSAEGGYIERGDIDGNNFNPYWLPAKCPSEVAVDGAHIYWTGVWNSYVQAIARANIDGTAVNHHLITGLDGPLGIAVDGLTGPTSTVHCVVPKVKGKKLGKAKTLLRNAHCALGNVTRKKSKRKPGRVISQNPKPGTVLAPGAKVAVVVSKR